MKNREKKEEYYIDSNWYKNRKPGISAMIRAYNEERWIGPCIESILPFFDEIVITLDCSDRTREIINTFDSDKIKVYDYPFFIGETDGENHTDSVHDMVYYYNYTMAKTTKQIVSKWDADMIMLPYAYKYYNLIKKKNIVRAKGYNVVSIESPILSRNEPYLQYEIRFSKVKENLFYIQPREKRDSRPLAMLESFAYNKAGLLNLFNSTNWKEIGSKKRFLSLYLYRLYNLFTKKDIYLKKPICLHTKFLKDKKEINTKQKHEYQDGTYDKGERINIEIPDFVSKKPEEYLQKR